MTIAYPDDNRDAGSYNVVANFAEGANYLEGYVVFENALVIKKANGDETLPTIDRQFVDTVLSGAIGETGWSYAEDKTIVEGDNAVVVTKTISADIAKNYDFAEDAVADGYQIVEQDDKSLVLTATITVVGYYGEGTVKLVLNPIADNVSTGDVVITVTPVAGGNAQSVEFTETAEAITINGLSLVDGTYTMTVKKQKYLETVITFTVKQNEEIDLGKVSLIAGDIVGEEKVIDIDDFVIAIRAFDTNAALARAAADIDGDGENTVSDLIHIKTNFHKTTADNCTITLPVVSE